jgi:hypothetical protein
MMKPLLLATVLAVIAPVGAASAATIRVDYTGVITQVNNTTEISGYTVGENITGEMILTLPNAPQRSYMYGVPFFDEYDGTGSSTINGNQISGYGSIVNRTLSSFAALTFGVSQQTGGQSYGDDLDFEGAPAPLLGSLESLPTSLTAIESYLGNRLFYIQGNIFASAPGTHLWDITWNVESLQISPVSQTPIPATLPLFVSALGGLGFLRSRRFPRRGASGG